MSDRRLSTWTIYDHPRDYPFEFVARRFELVDGKPLPTSDVLTSRNLDLLRGELASRHLCVITRYPHDGDKIIEVWL